MENLVRKIQIFMLRLYLKINSKKKKQLNELKVSVIIPCHNRKFCISDAIKSLLNQTHKNIEIILIDDGSTDGSTVYIENKFKNDSRIKLLKNAKNCGTGYSRNVGLNNATGDYITFLDSDDISKPSRIFLQLLPIFMLNQISISTCDYNRVTGNQILTINGITQMQCIISMMFPAQAAIENVGYFRDISVSEDSDYYERLKIYFGVRSEYKLPLVLYLASFLQNSSLFSATSNLYIQGNNIKYSRSEKSDIDWKILKIEHEKMRQGQKSVYIEFNE